MLAMVSCTPSTPGTALKNYMSALSDKDYEKFIDGCNISEADSEKAKEIREGLIAMIQEKGSKTIEKKGGLKEVEIVSEEMAEDGNSAIVTYKQHYGDGSVKEDTQKMIKVDGKWLMDIGK